MSDQSLTIRVSRSTHELLRDLATKSNTTITAVVDEAVQHLQRKRFWADFNSACEALQADSAAWADLRHEDVVWEQTLSDGLQEKESYDNFENRLGESSAG